MCLLPPFIGVSLLIVVSFFERHKNTVAKKGLPVEKMSIRRRIKLLDCSFLVVLCMLMWVLGLSATSRVRSFAFLAHSHQRRRVASTRLFSSTTTKTSTTKVSTKLDIPIVHVHRNAQSKAFRQGSALVFAKSVNIPKESPVMDTAGALVQVRVPLDNNNNGDNKSPSQVIGWGMYNPHSLYRIRILCHALLEPSLSKTILTSSSSDEALGHLLEHKFQAALRLRRALGLKINNNNTDTFRLVHGEGDGLSGLAVDVLGGKVAVVMSSAVWCELHKDMIQTCLQRVLEDDDIEIVWKTTPSRLKQDGYEQVFGNLPVKKETTENDKDGDDMVLCTENGIRYQTFPRQPGQKTGFYCDQRENRAWIAQYINNNTRVLDLCCYQGGFALNAAQAGASHVVGVDSSQDAIDACKANAKLNGFEDGDQIEFVKADIVEYMKQLDNNPDFDVVILDPPKLAPTVASLSKAKRKYKSLNSHALACISQSRGGWLLTCTCSAAMAQSGQFVATVQQAAVSAGRQLTLSGVRGPASCHVQSPASYPNENYLTAALFYVHPIL